MYSSLDNRINQIWQKRQVKYLHLGEVRIFQKAIVHHPNNALPKKRLLIPNPKNSKMLNVLKPANTSQTSVIPQINLTSFHQKRSMQSQSNSDAKASLNFRINQSKSNQKMTFIQQKQSLCKRTTQNRWKFKLKALMNNKIGQWIIRWRFKISMNSGKKLKEFYSQNSKAINKPGLKDRILRLAKSRIGLSLYSQFKNQTY